MTFLWPEMLWLLAAAPALAGAYVLLLRRKKKGVLRYASLSLVRDAIGPGQRLRRHLPPALFLAAMTAALVAIARPSALITLPSESRTIILAIDVSLSMRATDVKPHRLGAAQAAAKAFLREIPPDVRIGIVSFAGTASLVQRPTNNREDLVAAVDRLQLDRQTSLGSGIVVALATLFPDHGIDLEEMVLGARQPGGRREKAPQKPAKAFTPVPPGSNASAAIVLLTDGRRTTGPDPLETARMAAERGTRIFTVGLGSAEGGSAMFEGYSIYMMFDEETLKSIAEITRAEYFPASSADELTRVYESLSARLVLEKERTEITALFAAAAAALLAATAVLAAVVAPVCRRARRRQPDLPTWDCGYAGGSPRLQYTASSFAQLITSRFAWALRPEVHAPRITKLFPAAAHFHSHARDPVLDGLLVPAGRAALRVSARMRAWPQGQLQRYILYILAVLVPLLVWAMIGGGGDGR